MLFKHFYTRFLFFFIIYLGINLLLIKIKTRDYAYDNILSFLKRPKAPVERNKLIVYEIKKVNEEKSIVQIFNRSNESDPVYNENEKTIKQIVDTCKENNLTTVIVKRNFLYSQKHGGLYCWIRKAASTSFTKLFADINNRNVTHNYYREIDKLAPKTKAGLQLLISDKNVFKFLVVRHPFERLVSAYRDRIEDNSKFTAQSWIYAQKIFHLTRPELFISTGRVDESLLKIFYEDKRLKLVPSFGEFVKWLLTQDSAKDDPHWNQYHRHCSLCSVRYDFVLKLDNHTQSDIDFILNRMDINTNKIYLSNLEETRGGRTNFDETCNYFKNLTHESVVSLYEKYRIDFDMFNYEFDKYFECTDGD